MGFDFAEVVKSQGIFQSVLGARKGSDTRSKLVARRNKDVFFAGLNTIRCCTINSKSANFYLLVSKKSFAIAALELNNSGTYLAAVGKHNIEVFSVPANINESACHIISTKQYTLQLAEHEVLKAVWQASAASDGCLVVLYANNSVAVYNVSVGEGAVMTVDLASFACFEGEQAVSISFGSDVNLAGSLTLYVATKSGRLFAFYPFLAPAVPLVASSDQILAGCAETLDLMQLAATEFPSLVDDAYSDKLYQQLKFYVFLKKQLEDRINVVERRFDATGKAVHAYKLDHNFSGTPVLQPLSHEPVGSISDISSLGNHSQLSVLAAVSGASAASLAYFSQLKPLLMNNDFEATEPEQPALAETRDEHYAKPSVGFGYIDESSDDEPDPESAVVSPAAQKNAYFTKTLRGISTIAIDKLPGVITTDENSSIITNDSSSRFWVQTKDAKLAVNPVWIEKLVLGSMPERLASDEYIIFDSKDHSEFVFLSDDVTFTGTYGVELHFKQGEAPVELYEIESTKPQKLVLTLPEQPKEPTIKLADSQDALLQEITERIKNLDTNTPDPFVLDPNASSLDKVELLNNFSVESIESIGDFTEVLVKISMNLSTSLVTLKNQVEFVSSLYKTEVGLKQKDRLDELKQRQTRLSSRLSGLQAKLIEKLEDLKVHQNAPLSQAEKDWIDEVSRVNSKLDGQIEGQIDDLKKQVESIKHKTQTSDIKPDLLLSTIDLTKVKELIKTQTDSINDLKAKLQSLTTDI